MRGGAGTLTTPPHDCVIDGFEASDKPAGRTFPLARPPPGDPPPLLSVRPHAGSRRHPFPARRPSPLT